MKRPHWLLALVLVFSAFPAYGDDCEQGIKYYNDHNYAAASEAFNNCLRSPVADPNIVYYAALTAQQLRQIEKAKTLFSSIVQHFPKSPAGKLSSQALRNLSGPLESATLPRETWVPFERVGTHLFLDVEVNRKPVKMIFDTGADHCLFSESLMAEVGVPIPNRAPDAYSGGVGKSSFSPVWMIPVTVKLGSIERRNFRVGVSKTPQAVALLGRDFYAGLEYTINDSNKTIGFKRFDTSTGSASATPSPIGPDGSLTVSGNGTYVYNIPYRTEGTMIVVQAKINNRPCDMIFDTGASVCFFTPAQASQVRLTIPANAPVFPVQGVGGTQTAQLAILESVKLGKIEQRNVECAVGGKAVSPMPLLGQTFFKDFEYTIDSNNKVLHFKKR